MIKIKLKSKTDTPEGVQILDNDGKDLTEHLIISKLVIIAEAGKRTRATMKVLIEDVDVEVDGDIKINKEYLSDKLGKSE